MSMLTTNCANVSCTIKVKEEKMELEQDMRGRMSEVCSHSSSPSASV